MLRKIFFGLAVLGFGIGAMVAGAGLWVVKNGSSTPLSSSAGQVLPATHRYVEVPTLPVVIADTSGDSYQYFECQQVNCRPRISPADTETARFDGSAWYFYDKDGSLRKLEGAGKNALLVAPTALVEPRDIIMSPRGGNLAYWLDDTTKDGAGLTELWVYGGASGGTFIVAERLVADDIVTQPQWNGAGTALWFLADSGSGSQEKLEFIVANVSPTLVKARFANAVVEALQHAAQQGLVDITPSGTTLAFASENEGGRHTLHVVRDGGATEIKQLSGRVSYVQWVGEGELLYAVQQQGTIEFWRYANATHTLLGKQSGVLLSALVEADGRYIGYGVSEGQGQNNLRILDTSSGLSRVQSPLPRRNNIQVVHVGSRDEPKVFGITTELNDGQLIAFVESQANRIIGKESTLVRMVVTEKPNTLFVDYEQAGQTHRLLITVRDAIHPEWAILGKYEPAGGQWQRLQGGDQDPVPLRLYEWENTAGQWILKQELRSTR